MLDEFKCEDLARAHKLTVSDDLFGGWAVILNNVVAKIDDVFDGVLKNVALSSVASCCEDPSALDQGWVQLKAIDERCLKLDTLRSISVTINDYVLWLNVCWYSDLVHRLVDLTVVQLTVVLVHLCVVLLSYKSLLTTESDVATL
jgi:hypothetical protein